MTVLRSFALLAASSLVVLPLSLVACDDEEEATPAVDAGTDAPTSPPTTEPTEPADGGDSDAAPPATGTIGAGPYSIAYVANEIGIDLRPNVTATFGAGGELESYTASAQEAPTRGTNQVGELFMDAKSALGRWHSGTSAGTFYANTTGYTFSATQGFHYALVQKATAMPASGDVQYTLAKATAPTVQDGSFAVGTVTGTAGVSFAGAGTKLGFDLTATIPGDGTYEIKTTGGAATPATTEVTVFNTSAFSTAAGGDVVVTSTGAACAGGGTCKAIIDGVVGEGGDRIAISVSLGKNSAATKTVRFAAVFKKP